MTICDGSCDPVCFGCQIRDKGLQVSPAATPTRRNNLPGQRADPVWERGIITDRRVDGSVMPVFEPGTRHPLHVKQYAENKRTIDGHLKRLRQPSPT